DHLFPVFPVALVLDAASEFREQPPVPTPGQRIPQRKTAVREAEAKVLHCFVVAANAQKSFDSVCVCRRQVGSRKTGKDARMSIRAKPGDLVARARRARNTAEFTDGSTRGRRRGSHVK